MKKSGLSPKVAKAEVKGTNVYRLSVDGFPTRADALGFIRQAEKKYGLKGGWVQPK